MNGIHDLGGMDGFGPVEPEPDEPVFHATWEGRVMAIARAMDAAGVWNIDMARAAREELPPHILVTSSYYQKWQGAMEKQVVAAGLVGADELAAGHASEPARPLPRPPLRADALDRVMKRGSFARPATSEPRFRPGDRVRTRNINPETHTRLPRYARNHLGLIERVQGFHTFPDRSALGEKDAAEWLYTVVFEARELWGADADATLKVSIEAFEPYLERA
jgi:nitrile hydratase beta subunit